MLPRGNTGAAGRILTCDMRTDELDFDLPPELIAQEPPPERHASRLLHYRRADRSVQHRTFSDLPALLPPGDLLVFNNARVLPARFMLRKETGGKVEGLFLREPRPGRWHVLLKGMGSYGSRPLRFVGGAGGHRQRRPLRGGRRRTRSTCTPIEPAAELLARVGPDAAAAVHQARQGARRAGRPGPQPVPDRLRREPRRRRRADGGAALFRRAPDATGRGGRRADVRDAERRAGDVQAGDGGAPGGPRDARGVVLDPRRGGRGDQRREGAGPAGDRRRHDGGEGAGEPAGGRAVRAASGETGIFIRPPYQWKHVDALVTNFHLPRSTLIALVAAMVGLEEQRRLYRIAIEQRYRFFSYGDAMLIE